MFIYHIISKRLKQSM